MRITRRGVIAAGALALAAPRLAKAQGAGRIVVIGGGFGGATAARALHRAGHQVTLIERKAQITTCPFSNTVLGGFGEIADLTFDLRALADEGITVIQASAEGVDPAARTVTLDSGDVLNWDRLVLSPGIALREDALPGYAGGADLMPHAWVAGPQTELLAAQIRAMPQGGTLAIHVPAPPYRCPPGPYERASLIAHYFTQHNPTAKILILDDQEGFSKQPLFQEAWSALYPGMIEWRPPSLGGRVVEVDPAAMVIETEFSTEQVDVANIIPPQEAGAIARAAGVVDATRWCPVDAVTFESDLVPGVHVIGDAAFAGTMPKSAFTANMNGKAAAVAIDSILREQAPRADLLVNTCYSLAAPDYGFTVAGVYRPVGGKFADVEGAGGLSPLGGNAETHAAEAGYARSWYANITAEIWGAR